MAISISQRLRGALFASTALLALPAVAFADEGSGRPLDALESPHEDVALTAALSGAAEEAYRNAAARAAVAVETPEITINNNFTPTDARDPVNINGIGQIVVDAGSGSVGLCTASLINPRVVLFAAHCVNTRAATAYGAGSGGVGIAIGFETNTRANAAGQPDELVNWLLGAGAGPGQFRTNRAQQLYNIDQVFWNPASVAAASCTAPGSCFLEGDIATAVLDAPTRNVPTWALMFSPLATPSAINPATGTGYHVAISGYGRFGTGTTGQNGGNDFRRRAAENMLGALTSINARNLFLFGTAGSPSRPQLLYWLDFDDPARGTAAANPRDFNGFRDNALQREGLTGPGDSGGPLILDQAFSKSVILGVLSGGSTFFGGQPGGSYGTQSFYQPLFLYWDWIVANNPYRYVTATVGNKNWEDATAWVTTLDPAYNILSGGTLVNGVPTELGGTIVANTPQFGELCFQSPLNGTPITTNECQNLTTGAARNNVPNTPSGTTDSSPTLTALITDMAEPDSFAVADTAAALAQTGSGTGVARDGMVAIEESQASPGYRDGALPTPTLANGLPGATNFVPNNVNGVRATGVAGRYYDVTLRNAGIVSLNSAVTIDRFAILGASSQLTVNAGASLTSLIDIMHSTGIVQNNGTISTDGDYLFTSGLLSGTGRVNTPFLTSVLGNFAPGTLGTVGTLTIGGNVVMASGSTFAVDLGPSGTSDRLAIVANGTSTGLATLGGRVVFSPAAGNTIRANDLYTILTATGGVSGTFTTSALSAILTPQLIYTANTVQARINAGSYFPLGLTPAQRSFAALLDRNRGGSNVAPLYDFLDLQNAATIQATLESWAPRTETLKAAIGTTAVDNMNRFFRGRLAGMDIANGFGGQVATLGNPLQTVARMSSSQLQPGQPVMGYGQDAATEETSAALPDTVSVFLAAGYLDGESASMATAVPFGGDDNYDGYYVAAGVESELGDNAGIGFALSYTDIDGTTGGAPQGASGKLYQGTLYGKLQNESGLTLDTQVSAAMFSARTERTAVLGPTSYNLQSKDDVLALSAEVGLGKSFDAGSLKVGPRVAMRASQIDFTPTTETGGAPALQFDRGRYDSLQGMAGLTLSGGAMKFRPYASAYFVHEFQDKPASFGANFVGGVGLPAVFALTGTDKNWFEASAGIAFGSETFEIALGADTTIGRSDVSNRSYRGTVTFRF